MPLLLLLLLVSTNRFSNLEPQWHLGAPLRDGDTWCKSFDNAWSIPKPRSIYLLGGAAEEGLGESREGGGGYGNGFGDGKYYDKHLA